MPTPEERDRLASLAISVAMYAPKNRNPMSVSVLIPWHAVEAIRAALDAAGIDWRAMHDNVRSIDLTPSTPTTEGTDPR